MRVLFTFAGGNGHAHPLVPIASAASRAGHEVALAGQARTVTTLAHDGWRTFVDGRIARGAGPQTPLLALDVDREERVLREHFAGPLGT